MEISSFEIEYISETLEKVEEVDRLILKIENSISDSSDYQQDMDALKRIVHTIKGSASSYGLSFASTICHNFEDFLQVLEGKTLTKSCTSSFFDYLDLLNDYFGIMQKGVEVDPQLTELKQRLISLGGTNKEYKHDFKVLIVEHSKTLQKLYQASLDSLGVQISFCQDGLLAIQRIIEEQFDCVVVSKNLEKLSGVNLVNMIKSHTELSKATKMIIVTSDEKLDSRFIKADKILFKNENLASDLNKYIEDVINFEDQDNSKILKNKPLDKIFYIDDDKTIHKIVKFAFKKGNQKITFFENGKSALDNLLNGEKPQLILLDYMMPEMNGEAVIEKINATKELKGIPVVFMTGLETEGEKEKLISLGAKDVITKPFRPKTLMNNIISIWKNI